MRRVILTILVVGTVLTVGVTAQAADRYRAVQPYGDPFELGEPSYHVERLGALFPVGHLQLGTEHILDQQCHNGGFGWPHDDCSVTWHNITAPIILGVLRTYNLTLDPTYLVGALNGGIFDLTSTFDNGEAKFSTFTPIFLHDLALASGNTSFSTWVTTQLFDELAAGTYGPADLDTAGWIAAIETDRSGGVVNLRPWEFSTLVPAARALGQTGQEDLFEQGVLDGLDTLDRSDPGAVTHDILGVAGAVRGLAFAGRSTFPAVVAPLHSGVNGIDNLEALATYLASLQNPNGSWDWHSNLPAPTAGDEDTQTTAYALLALLQVDILTAASYQAATEAARDYLLSVQLPSGGFTEWPGGPENTEVEGEAVNAIADFDATIFVDGFESGTTDLWSLVAP
jgi:hypothetical protein